MPYQRFVPVLLGLMDVYARQWMISLAAVFCFLPALLPAQPTTWEALTPRIPGLSEQRLRHLEQSYAVEEVEPNLLKMTHTETGMVKHVDITNHTFDFDKPPANVQVIDLINADTTLYNWKYIRKNMFPIGSLVGYPMTIGDFNNNGIPDLAGSYQIPQIFFEIADCAIAELQADSTFTIQKVYADSTPIVLANTDVDNDGLEELFFTRAAQYITNYEQSSLDSFPNIERFRHRTWELSGEVSREIFTDLDRDGYREVLYKGDDSLQPNSHQIFIAEYKPTSNTMERIFGYIPSPDWRTSRFSVGDFDIDGFWEFVTGSVTGYVYVVENTGDDIYQPTFQDTISTPNAYLTTQANDIDGNGQIEFFLGGSAFYNGVPATRIYWFEANGNNNYVKRRSFFLLGTDVLGFDLLSVYDVNSDGIDDLVCSFSFSVVMLIWNLNTNEFDLHYFDQWENFDQEIHSTNMYDVFNSGKHDLFVNVKDIVTTPRIRTYFYRPNTIVGISQDKPIHRIFNLYRNYPNPFNNNTNIGFYLPKSEKISLNIYDLNGKEVICLINKLVYASGEHSIKWNALTGNGKEVSSGIYFYVLQRENRREVRKMLLIK
ncbi:MAG: hypothetical protein CV087_10150 [Candidatus Brocadia sp. WS118]|nr:MAG: hypothetical protein CV087_10150 [Candidatus Brocadia sp. WS118]